MKYLFLLIMCLTLFSCQKETQDIQYNKNITACDTKEPQKNLPWLAEMIAKAKNDKTGNYKGTIWLVNYKGQDIFVTNMMLGSGGVLNWFFDCSGNHLIYRRGEGGYCPSEYVRSHHFFVEDEDDFQTFINNVKLEIVIYSNVPL